MPLLLFPRHSPIGVAAETAVEGKSKTYRQFPPGDGPVEVSYGKIPAIVYDDVGLVHLSLSGYATESFARPPILAGWGVESHRVYPAVEHVDAATVFLALRGFALEHQQTDFVDAGIGGITFSYENTVASRERAAQELSDALAEAEDDLLMVLALL